MTAEVEALSKKLKATERREKNLVEILNMPVPQDSAKDDEIARLKAEVAALKQQNEESRKEADLERRLKEDALIAANEELRSLKHDAEKACEMQADLNQCLQAMSEENGKLQQKVEQISVKIDADATTATTEISTLQKKIKEMEEKDKSKKSEVRDRWVELKEQYDEWKAKAEVYKQTAKDLGGEVSEDDEEDGPNGPTLGDDEEEEGGENSTEGSKADDEEETEVAVEATGKADEEDPSWEDSDDGSTSKSEAANDKEEEETKEIEPTSGQAEMSNLRSGDDDATAATPTNPVTNGKGIEIRKQDANTTFRDSGLGASMSSTVESGFSFLNAAAGYGGTWSVADPTKATIALAKRLFGGDTPQGGFGRGMQLDDAIAPVVFRPTQPPNTTVEPMDEDEDEDEEDSGAEQMDIPPEDSTMDDAPQDTESQISDLEAGLHGVLAMKHPNPNFTSDLDVWLRENMDTITNGQPCTTRLGATRDPRIPPYDSTGPASMRRTSNRVGRDEWRPQPPRPQQSGRSRYEGTTTFGRPSVVSGHAGALNKSRSGSAGQQGQSRARAPSPPIGPADG